MPRELPESVKATVGKLLREADVIVDHEALGQSRPHLPSGCDVLDYLIGGKPGRRGVAPCPGIPRGMVTHLIEGNSASPSHLSPFVPYDPLKTKDRFEPLLLPKASIVVRQGFPELLTALVHLPKGSPPQVLLWVMDENIRPTSMNDARGAGAGAACACHSDR